MRSVLRILLIVQLFVLAGCSWFQDNPYASFSIGDVNETAPETAATILVGDPQVITRETLINDRMREVDHIDDMIKDSVKVTFEPQLRRDLSVINSFAAQLGISFNPAAGAAFKRNEKIAELKTDIEVLKLRNELDRLKKLSEEDPSSAKLDPSDTKPGPPEGVNDPSTAEIKSQLAAAVKRATDILDSLKKEGAIGARARETTIKASPEEHFEDLNAYRARLRQRQVEIRLDDVHDTGGNSLYRLQFTAAVLPGRVKNKFGVLDLEIGPGETSIDAVQRLYERWLTSLAGRDARLRSAPAADLDKLSLWERIQTELMVKKLVRRVLLFDQPTRSGDTATLVLFVFPGDEDTIIDMLNSDGAGDRLIKAARGIKSGTFSNFSLDSKTCRPKNPGSAAAVTYNDVIAALRTFRSLSVIEVFLSAQESMARKSPDAVLFTPRLLSSLKESLTTVATATRKLEQSILLMIPARKREAALACFDSTKKGAVPPKFKDAVTETKNNKLYWKGKSYTYQAQPTERVQRLSTLTSAVNSMQMAFSLVATLPGSGIGLNAGAGAARTAVGMAEAIERSPLVIGYTDRQSATPNGNARAARFGFLFGPKAVLKPGANSLEYQQIAANHPVFADISVPGWWPALSLDARTAWTGNWYDGTTVLQSAIGRSIEVRLRPKFLESLTDFLVDDPYSSDLDRSTIEDWNPKSVSACGGDVTFVVKGKNLWRSPVAYLRGKKHKSIKVLPDMEGIAVTFNFDNRPPPPDLGEEKTELRIWTSIGPATPSSAEAMKVSIVQKRLGRPCPGIARSGEGVSLSPDAAKYAKGVDTKISVNIGAPLPASFRNVKVITQLSSTTDQKYTVDTASNIVSFPGKSFEGTINIDPPAAPAAFDGASLRVGLSYQTIDGGALERAWARKAMIYYPTARHSQFAAKTKKVAGLPDDIELELPARFEEAYPKFVKAADAFDVTVVGHTKIKLAATADWVKVQGRVFLRITKNNSGDPKAEKAFKTAWCAGSLTLNLSLTDKAGIDRPGGSQNVTLSKRTTGCRASTP